MKLIDWAHEYEVFVVSDNPYSEICFDGYCVPTFLQFDGAKEVGIELNPPKAIFYIWAGIPEGFSNSKEFCQKVLDDIAVWMITGSMYGKYGDGYFRIALTHPAPRLKEAMDRLANYLI